MQLTIREAAGLLGARESQVRRWIRDRGLPAVLFNEQYRLNRVDLLAWAQANRVPVSEQALAPRTAFSVSLGDALARGGIHREVPGATRAAALCATVARIALPDAVDRELLLEMTTARAVLGWRAIGHGIAIPHTRYPTVAAVPEPTLALAFLGAPVAFDAPDGAPDGELVGALFVLVAPTVRAHLNLVARLAGALTAELLAPVVGRADDASILAAAGAGDALVDGGDAAPGATAAAAPALAPRLRP